MKHKDNIFKKNNLEPKCGNCIRFTLTPDKDEVVTIMGVCELCRKYVNKEVLYCNCPFFKEGE